MSYRVFSRTWWERNTSWPNGLEPSPGDKRTIKTVNTEAEAREACKEWMGTHQFSKEDKHLALAAEYERIN